MRASVIQVEHGYFLPPPNVSARNLDQMYLSLSAQASPIRCPMRDACSGGNQSGTSSCTPGHTGPLCGVCNDGFYRTRDACLICPDEDTDATTSVAVLAVAPLELPSHRRVHLSDQTVTDRNCRRPRSTTARSPPMTSAPKSAVAC